MPSRTGTGDDRDGACAKRARTALAASNPDDLIRFWLSANSWSILRVLTPKFWSLPTRFALAGASSLVSLGHIPFSVYGNGKLKKFISSRINFTDLTSKHLIVCTKNYIKGERRAFYASKFMQECCALDAALPPIDRRLNHCSPIADQNSLVTSLLASTAIPIAFPPVKVGDDLHIDGGVGNNTPTREAAYFLRHIEERSPGSAGDTYCIKQEPPFRVLEGRHKLWPLAVLFRTIDVYGYIHMDAIVKSWYQINQSTERQAKKIEDFIRSIEGAGGEHCKDLIETISQRIRTEVGRQGGATQRRAFPMTEIEPSAPLGDTLEFKKKTIRNNIRIGYSDMLRVLRAEEKLDAIEHGQLVNRNIFPT